MSKKRLIFSAGGTGGHLFPAQAVADEVSEECEVLFVGGGLSKNRYFNREKYRYTQIDAAPFTPKGCFKILKGIWQSLKILGKEKPDLVVGFGSFYTFPLLVAARLKKIPILLHEQNSLPGKVNRLFAPHAKAIAITFPESASFLKGKAIPVSFPLRFKPTSIDRKIPLHYFGLEEGKKTLLIFGGSQGGAGLNRLVLESVPHLPKEVQVLHFTGSEPVQAQAQALYATWGLKATVKIFEERMDLAWSLADLAITRAGAATIAELVAWEVPALLIPFPYATDAHQEVNGAHFTEHVGGGSMFLEGKITPEEFSQTCKKALETELLKRREAIRTYKKQHPCMSMRELILRQPL